MPKSETGWASIPAGKLKSAESKLWVALGDHAKKVAERLDDNVGYRERVVRFMIDAPKLLHHLVTISVSAYKRFVAKDVFTKQNQHVKFWYFNDAFTEHFLDKVEENIPSAELDIYRLERDATDDEIRRGLTSKRKETTLAHFYELLSKQPNGEKGILLTSGSWTSSDIRDAKGILWAVLAAWNDGDGWIIHAHSGEKPDRGYQGNRVVSRK